MRQQVGWLVTILADCKHRCPLLGIPTGTIRIDVSEKVISHTNTGEKSSNFSALNVETQAKLSTEELSWPGLLT